ncbi:MAG TPA: hypothetical protein VF599_11750 [Pyrinomonadaceae bacterium]|jgi:hypothetical protein
MRKHIFGLALFALISGSAIFVYQLFYPGIKPEIHDYLPGKVSEKYPVTKPTGLAKDIYTINPTSVVVDVKSRKVYAGIDDIAANPSPNEFVKVVMFAENSGMVVVQTRWLNYMESTNLVFSCDECAAMNEKKNYYARVYIAKAPDDANLKLHVENEKDRGYYLQATPVLVNSGKK